MGLIDSHNHIYLEDFDEDRESLISAAKESGISMLLLPNIDAGTIAPILALYELYPDFVCPMMGLHPTSVDFSYVEALQKTEKALSERNDYCGIGEIGIDLYWDKTHREKQILVFEEQLRWSIDLDLPVAIHTREAYPEVFESIYKVGADKLKGVFHSFTGSERELEEINKLNNFKIGINGVVTFKNSGLAETLKKHAKLDKIILETDAPYLSPVPFRGKRNIPTYIWNTAGKVAEIFEMGMEDVVNRTYTNTISVFSKIKVHL